MEPIRLQALAYVVNAGRGATPDAFRDDFEPVGSQLLDGLLSDRLVTFSDSGSLVLTYRGADLLRRRVKHARSVKG